MFLREQHAGLGAGIDHGVDLVGGDDFGAHLGQAEERENPLREAVEEPHQRLEQGLQQQHRLDQRHRRPLRRDHGQALGHQVGEEDEEGRHHQEGQGKADVLQQRADIEGADDLAHVRRQRGLADHATEDGHRIQADLHHREEIARLRLQESTRSAFCTPSLDIISRRILREAAIEISAQERKALTTTRSRISSRLANRLMLFLSH
jgi:hypothetical protein